MLIDIDAGDFSEMGFAVETADNLKLVFDTQNIPYHLRFSGMGFHFIVPYRYFPSEKSLNPYENKNIYQYMKKISEKLNKKYSEMIDYNIYDSRRIAKLPYSLSIYNDGTYICCPVNDLKNFNYQDYNLAKFKKIKVIDDVLHNPEFPRKSNIKIKRYECN